MCMDSMQPKTNPEFVLNKRLAAWVRQPFLLVGLLWSLHTHGYILADPVPGTGSPVPVPGTGTRYRYPVFTSGQSTPSSTCCRTARRMVTSRRSYAGGC